MDPHRPPEKEVAYLRTAVRMPSKPILQTICTLNGLPKTGNKIDLQGRIIRLIDDCIAQNDSQRYREIYQSVCNVPAPSGSAPAMPSQPPYYPPNSAHTPSQPRFGGASYSPPGAASYSPGNGYRPANTVPLPASTPSSASRPLPRPRLLNLAPPAFQYKQSPFFEVKYQLTEVKTCEVMAAHRNSVSLTLSAQDIEQCVADKTMRVMVFCASGNTGVQDIAFPHQSEMKVNTAEVKANLRGLKNKPGSTRPVDITDYLRMKPSNYANKIDFTYALTSKRFYLCLYVCKATPVEALVGKIQKKIRTETVISEITKKASDPDVIATSQNLSLKCPLTYMRLNLPCRGLSCSHIQCFDATSYLQLQEQGPQWICPICNKSAPFDQLAVDEYVREILANTSDSTEQVTIEPDGEWAVPGARKMIEPKTHESNLVDDDDLVVSSVSKSANFHTPTPTRAATSIAFPNHNYGTPTNLNGASRDSSMAARSGSKRPAPEVIDLTGSDDEEEDQYRPVKRANLGQNGYGLH
ncbi:PINIT domain-containing protein [Lasiosphaeria hispida]|uniref:PINIT domain-containing protein n=1 Tax=Lasiosphaeria hispida TaxID=260671 RepID=A0AAJ0HLJ4_9PEZI|nr:PINIT domain-containing protein [Lasiosphaeria hispida]